MFRTLLLVVLVALMPSMVLAACSSDDLIGTWILRGEGQASPRSAAPALCAASARAIFNADGSVRFSKITTGCAEGTPTTVTASGTWQFDGAWCHGQMSLTDSLGYTIPFFTFLVFDEGRALQAIHQHRPQKAVYRWSGQRQ